MHALTERHARRLADTRRVTLVGAAVNLVLSVVKVLVGWVGHSQALIADGVHSLSDLLSDALVWYAAHHSAQAPDANHPYGHGRFETLATLGLAVLLLMVAAGIVWDAVSRLFAPETLQLPTMLVVYAAILSIVSKEALYHYTLAAARRHKSEMLRANAWHHRSDSVSSVVVLVGVIGAMAGLNYLDALAAAMVGLMIARIAWELAGPAILELADTGLEEEHLERIRATIMAVSGVQSIHMLRTRRSGGIAALDVHLIVSPWISVSEGHMIAQQVSDTLVAEIDEVEDVTVHIDPEDDEEGVPCQGLPLRAEAESILAEAWSGIHAYRQSRRVLLHYLDGKIDVNLQLPLDVFVDQTQHQHLLEQLRTALDGRCEFRKVTVSYH